MFSVLHEPTPADSALLEHAVAARTPWLDSTLTAVTNIGSTALSLTIFVALAFTVTALTRSWLPVLAMAVASACSTTLTSLLKLAFERPRPPYELAVPPYEHSFSFPSGHSLNAMALALILAYCATRMMHSPVTRWLTWLTAIAYPLIIGATRIFLGHHWLTDVLAGWALGVLIAGVAIALLSRAQRRNTGITPLPVPLAAGYTEP